MFKFVKDFLKVVMPKPVRRLLLFCIHWSKFGLEERKNLELKNKHLGSRAFIIGNGPSILKQDLTRLSGEVTFVLNSFFHHPQYEQINPTYLCSCDPLLNDVEHRNKWYAFQKEKTKKTIKLFSKYSEATDKKNNLFQDHSVYYLHTPVPFLPLISNLEYCPTDLTKPLSNYGMAFIDIAILSAYYMGIKEIYLLGMDGGVVNSLEDYMNYNFYGPDPLISLERYVDNYNKFYVDKIHQNSYQGLYPKCIACITRTFSRNGVKIFNATVESDAAKEGRFELQRGELGFERVKLEEIL